MERHELHNKIIQQLRFHRISGLDEEQCADNILSIVEKDWTQGCSCYEGDKTGETWCCNKCGKPTKKTTTMVSDEEIFKMATDRLKNLSMHDPGKRELTDLEKVASIASYEKGAKDMRSIASARIAEMEEIINLTQSMRDAQNEYFLKRKTPEKSILLSTALSLEMEVDKILLKFKTDKIIKKHGL